MDGGFGESHFPGMILGSQARSSGQVPNRGLGDRGGRTRPQLPIAPRGALF